jgi:hypothetical protein
MKFVKDEQRGQKRIEKALKEVQKHKHVAVGILQDEQRDDGFSMIELAMVHEFGSNDGHIPQRSYIRSTCDAKRKEHIALIGKLHGKIIDGKLNARQALDQLGEVVSKDMVQTINNRITPDIADSTKAAKIRSLKKQKKKLSGVGFTPLVESGQLKGAITHEVRHRF